MESTLELLKELNIYFDEKEFHTGEETYLKMKIEEGIQKIEEAKKMEEMNGKRKKEMLKVLAGLYYENKIEPLSDEDEMKMSEEFKRGVEYGRSETLRILIEFFEKK